MSADAVFLHVIVALPCEARPFIDHWRLRAVTDFPGFRCYARDQVRLLVSGVGKVAAAAAVAACQAYFRVAVDQVWCNTGVAGHARLPLGSAVWAGKIRDTGNGQCWYPPLLPQLSLPVRELCTVDTPVTDYAGDRLYDMEAAGFYPTALRYASAELVHSLKVVSDNASQSVAAVRPELVENLMCKQLPACLQLLDALADLARQIAPDQEYLQLRQEVLTGRHFSAYQQRTVSQLLQRYLALGGSTQCLRDQGLPLADGGAVIRWLQATLPELGRGTVNS